MDKMTMAHEYAMLHMMMDRYEDVDDLEMIQWANDYADKMQAEADRRKVSNVPVSILKASMELEWQPDWSILPEGRDWIALDSDGGWRAYLTEPLPNHFMWSTGDDGDYMDLRCSVLNKYDGDWKDSLRKRPD